MTTPSRSRAQHLLDLAIPFLGVGAGAVSVVLFHNPMALIPRDPAERWRAAVLAYVAGVVASVTFVASVALIDRLEAAG